MTTWNREFILSQYHAAAERGRPYTWFNYQPINLPGYESTLAVCGRNCFDRSAALTDHLRAKFGDRPLKIIDWGCNLGFFCFELAKLGHSVTGVDNNAKNIELCRYLARTNEFPATPQFFCDELTPDSLANYRAYDIGLCFSVLHHLKKQKLPTLQVFADTYQHAYIEMDGAGFGRNLLFAFYWINDDIVSTNDRYGEGIRSRKTWYCSNHTREASYENIKHQNIIESRGVFRVSKNGKATVKKRELNAVQSHTWISTDLRHELEIYRRFKETRFFAQLIDNGENDDFQWIEIEYVCENGCFDEQELEGFFDFLADNKLFILDLVADSFLFTKQGLKVVDLESIFPIESTVAELVRHRTKRDSLPFNTYEEQLARLKNRLAKQQTD